MKIELKKLSDLKPAPYNPRQSNAEQEKQLKSSLEKFGVVEPIIFNKQTGFIVGGHFRIRELKKLGYKEIECVIVDLNEADEKELNIRLNANTGSWDWDELANNWDSELLSDWGLEIPGFEPTILEAEEDDFTAPEGGIETDIVLGDLFEIGEHRLLCGDSTCSDTVAKLMNGGKSELLFTSPPYSDMRDYNGEKDLSISNLIEFIPTFLPYAEYQVVNLGIQRKDNEIVQYWDDYINKAKECGYKFLSWNIWNREHPRTVAQQTSFIPIAHEWLFVFGKSAKDINKTVECLTAGKNNSGAIRQKDGSHTYRNYKTDDFKKINSVTTTGVSNSGEHPAMFPIELPTEYILAMTNEKDIITEPFLGSGSTMVASHQLKRKCYGMELDPKYCQVIIDRMKKLDPTIKIKRNGIELK
jgi:DNA modification methylase